MHEDTPKKGAPGWVVTFGDMMSLLLCFFVLLLSFSTMEIEKFKVVAGAMREAFGVQREHHYTEMPSGQILTAAGAAEASNYERITLFESIKVLITQGEAESQVEAELDESGVRLRLEGRALFTSGDARLKPDMLPFLREVVRAVQAREDRIVVEGHTDDRPIRGGRFPSNWELSTARAGAVVRWLVDNTDLPPHRLSAVGFADTRPVASNATAEGRARNRRVEILIEQPANGPRP